MHENVPSRGALDESISQQSWGSLSSYCAWQRWASPQKSTRWK
jgi:hypothetical protein